MENKIQVNEQQLLTAIENTIKRIREQEEKVNNEKKYHLTEQELKNVINYFLEKNKK